VAITNATIHPITAPVMEGATIVLSGGEITAIGPAGEVEVPGDAVVIDGTGRHVLPGFIDSHSHMGVYSWPSVEANSDGNEMTSPVTAHVRAEDALNLEDPAYERARAGGVTACLILPGSGNMIGGEGVVVKLRPNTLMSGMKMAEAPRHIKMAMGENPKRVYGNRGELPSTRMGIVAKFREVFTEAREYRDAQQRHEEALARHERAVARHEAKLAAGEDSDEPERPAPPEANALSQTLVDVMEGRVRVNVHSYRKDDIEDILRVSDEFGFRVSALHHVLEGYKLAPELARRGIAACTWPDWWGFKMEAYDATPYNMAIMADAGVTVALHSDSPDIVQRFPHEAAKAVKYGMTEEQALASITINPARVLGIDQWVGSLETGKHADVVVMSGPPLDMYSLVEHTFIDGVHVFDRATYREERDASVSLWNLQPLYASEEATP
jgi:imidazolonepropionase-like amidohydrolase